MCGALGSVTPYDLSESVGVNIADLYMRKHIISWAVNYVSKLAV